MDNTEYLKQLADTEKKNKQMELDQAKASALLSLQEQQKKAEPTYQAQRQQANIQSQIGAKNFAEFLAARGQTNQGISTQYEMSRQNSLGNALAGIDTAQNTFNTEIQNKVGETEQNYQNNLLNSTNQIDQNLNTNLYNERIRQNEAAIAEKKYQDQLKQQAFENNMQVKNFNRLSSGGSGGGKTTKPTIYKGVMIPYEYAVGNQIKGVESGTNTIRYQVGNDFVEFQKGTNPFTGTKNKDILTKGKLDLSKTFSNTYQPNNIGGIPLKTTGKKAVIKVNGNEYEQNIYAIAKKDTGDWWNPFDTKMVNTYYCWDGQNNKYWKLTNAEKKSYGLK